MLRTPHKAGESKAHSRHTSETMAQNPKGPVRKATLVILDSNALESIKLLTPIQANQRD